MSEADQMPCDLHECGRRALASQGGSAGSHPVGGTRAIEHLRLVAGELKMADVRTGVALCLFADFEDFSRLEPGPDQVQALTTMFDELLAWSEALAPLRERMAERVVA